MRTSIAGAALLGLLAACGGGNDDQAPTQTPAPSATAVTPAPADPTAMDAAAPGPKLSMIDIQTAFEKKQVAVWSDAAQTAALYAPDATLWYPGQDPLKGRDAIQKDHQNVLDTYTGSQLADARMWLKGNVIITQWVMTGTDKASSKPVSVSGIAVQTLTDDGLVQTEHTYLDYETLMKQGGEYKGPTPAIALLPLPTSLETHVARNDATEQANAAGIAAANQAWLKKDDKTFLGMFTDDVATWDFANDGVQHDKKYMQASIAAFRKAAVATGFQDKNIVAVEDFTIDEQEINMTQTAAYTMGKVHVPNTKKSVTTHSVEVDQWKDGKIVKSWSWSNSLEFDAQLGIGAAAPVKTAKPAATPATTATKPASH